MQRSACMLLRRSAVVLSAAAKPPTHQPPNAPGGPNAYHGDPKIREFTETFSMSAMATHERSTFEYRGSAKGSEVGARNEAAFLNYEEFAPKDVNLKYAMPHVVNLLSLSPIYCTLVCLASVAWGVFYWDLYCRKNYETVLIARPHGL